MKNRSPIQYLNILFIVLVCILAAGCKKPVPDDLQQAKDVIADMLSPLELHNSMFSAGYPECKPSEFVHFIFSDLGATEMPESRGSSGSNGTRDNEREAGTLGYRPWPEGIAMIALSPDPQKGRQIVLKPDDEHGMLTVELYEDPSKEAVAHYDLNVPQVTPSEMAKAAFHSNIQMGATY